VLIPVKEGGVIGNASVTVRIDARVTVKEKPPTTGGCDATSNAPVVGANVDIPGGFVL